MKLKTLRCHPILNAAIFIKATKCFRGFHLNICDDINILCSSNKIRGTVLTEQLIFLQRIVAKTNVIRGCLFWIKEAVLRIFAKWCIQNSNEIRLAPWQCLTNWHDFVRCCLLGYRAWIRCSKWCFAGICWQRLVIRISFVGLQVATPTNLIKESRGSQLYIQMPSNLSSWCSTHSIGIAPLYQPF